LDNKRLKKSIDKIISSNIIEISQIPDIDLYMDQITTFFDDKLKSNKRNEGDKIFTKTMINNYTKSELIAPPIKKKYSKDHIISLILIYHLKSILSMNDISKIFKNSKNSIKLLYSNFLDIQEKEHLKFKNEIYEQISEITNNCSDDKISAIIAILMLTNQAQIRKQLAENLIDTYFSESDVNC